MVIKLSLNDQFVARAMCSTSEMTFPVPPRLFHLPQDVNAENCHQQQQQEHFSPHYPQHQQQQSAESPSILDFTTSTVSRQFSYNSSASVSQQLSPEDRAMYNGTGPTTSYTAALTQDHPPPPISSESQLETSQSQTQTSDQHTTIPPLPTPANMSTYYENTFTRTLTGIYLQPPDTYRTPPSDDMYSQRGGETQQTEYLPTNDTYKNYPRSHYDGYSVQHSSEQDPQVSSGGLNSPFYSTTPNPYSLYRNTSFSNNNNNPDTMFTASSKYGGKFDC